MELEFKISIEFGIKVRDSYTGFCGTVSGIAVYSDRSSSVMVSSMIDGKIHIEWIPHHRLQVIPDAPQPPQDEIIN